MAKADTKHKNTRRSGGTGISKETFREELQRRIRIHMETPSSSCVDCLVTFKETLGKEIFRGFSCVCAVGHTHVRINGKCLRCKT